MKSDITFNSDKITYEGSNLFIRNEIEKLKDRKINFKAQTSFSLKAPEIEDPLFHIQKTLTDVKAFDNIPYYSAKHDSWSPLFSDIRILEQYINSSGDEIIITEQRIPPFSTVRMRYTVQRTSRFLLFKAVNIDTVKYGFLPVIREGQLFSLFGIEFKNEMLECYGLGAADTGNFFLFRKRIQAAFNGRTEALINWIYSKLLITAGHY